MTMNGWQKKYHEILNEFDYDRSKEIRSANILNSLLKTRLGLNKLEKKIKNKTVFVIGVDLHLIILYKK